MKESAGKDKQVKFDENLFFRHMRQNPRNANLLKFMRSIDKRACVQMAKYAAFYLTPHEEQEFLERRKRAAKNAQQTLSVAITALKEAAARYRAVAAIEIGNRPLIQAGEARWPEGSPPLEMVLEKEADRLSRLVDRIRPLSNLKRYGLSGNITWLLKLEDFVAGWTMSELHQERPIKATEIEALIEAAKKTLGWDTNMSPTTASVIQRSIRNFRSNAANAAVVQVIAQSIPQEIECVRRAPYLLKLVI